MVLTGERLILNLYDRQRKAADQKRLEQNQVQLHREHVARGTAHSADTDLVQVQRQSGQVLYQHQLGGDEGLHNRIDFRATYLLCSTLV